MTRLALFVTALVALVIAACNPIPEAHASPAVDLAALAHEGATAQTFGSVDSWKQVVGTTAERLGGARQGERPDADAGPNSWIAYQQIRCYTTDATAVWFGDDSVSATAGYPLCTDVPTTCGDYALTWPTNDLYAVVGAGTADVYCTRVK